MNTFRTISSNLTTQINVAIHIYWRFYKIRNFHSEDETWLRIYILTQIHSHSSRTTGTSIVSHTIDKMNLGWKQLLSRVFAFIVCDNYNWTFLRYFNRSETMTSHATRAFVVVAAKNRIFGAMQTRTWHPLRLCLFLNVCLLFYSVSWF